MDQMVKCSLVGVTRRHLPVSARAAPVSRSLGAVDPVRLLLQFYPSPTESGGQHQR